MEILLDIFYVFAVLSMIFTAFFLWNLIRNIRAEIQLIQDVKNLKDAVKIVYIEHHNGWSYAYDRITSQFIAHAESDDLVLAKAKSLFPKYKFTVVTKQDLTAPK